jgi:DNA-binding response OmpR family regulator
MKTVILVVEDNPDVLLNIKMTLEFNDYEVLSAKNGNEAVILLSETEIIPDLIISDIMMPEMDGYDFFEKILENPRWGLVPFLFLTAKASPEDIRFGKTLGIDDYITKPFEEEELLAIISGKIKRQKKANLFRKKIEDRVMSQLKIDIQPSLSQNEKNNISLFCMKWDESFGPEVFNYYPKTESNLPVIQEVGVQLFHSSVAIYGSDGYSQAQGILLRVEAIDKSAFIYFDSIQTESVRGGEQLFMLSVLAPKINYLETVKINEVFNQISPLIKNSQNWDVESSWKKVCDVLTTSSIPLE